MLRFNNVALLPCDLLSLNQKRISYHKWITHTIWSKVLGHLTIRKTKKRKSYKCKNRTKARTSPAKNSQDWCSTQEGAHQGSKKAKKKRIMDTHNGKCFEHFRLFVEMLPIV